MPSELTGVRVEYQRPRASGIGGGWWVSGSSAGRTWRIRFYGRDPVPDEQDAEAFWALPEGQRKRLVDGMVAGMEEAQYRQIRRRNEARKFRSGMRNAVTLALRDKQQRTPERPRPPVSIRPTSRTREPRRRSVRMSGRRARAPASKADDDSPPPDLTRLARASSRCWARVRRREAKQRVAWA